MKKFKTYAVYAFLLSSGLSTLSGAATESATSLGVLGGIGAYSDSLGSKFTFGGKLHHKLSPHFGTGLTVTYASLGSGQGQINAGDDFVVSASASASLLHADLDLDYHFADLLPGLWAGARLGL